MTYTPVDTEVPQPRSEDAISHSSSRLLDTFGSDDEDGSDWVDDREQARPEAAGSAEEPRRHWAGIFDRLRGKSEPQSGSADGVFGNLQAKSEDTRHPEPDNGEDALHEEPPTYEEAAADATPSYWETTIMASDWSDEVLVGDMPVGSPLHFAWNMLISATFSYVGFIITYLFHTSHAARGGSLAGFGCTLIQSSYYFTPSASAPRAPPDEFMPNDPNDFGAGPHSGVSHHAPDSGLPAGQADDGSNSSLVGTIMFVVGCVFIVRGIVEYVFALSLKNRILAYNSREAEAETEEAETETETDAPMQPHPSELFIAGPSSEPHPSEVPGYSPYGRETV